MRNWFVSGLVVFAGVSNAVLSAQKRAPVIDMHMHAHHIPLDLPAGAPPPCLPRPCQPKGAATATPEESLRKTLEAMDRHNIVLGFLSSADDEAIEAIEETDYRTAEQKRDILYNNAAATEEFRKGCRGRREESNAATCHDGTTWDDSKSLAGCWLGMEFDPGW